MEIIPSQLKEDATRPLFCFPAKGQRSCCFHGCSASGLVQLFTQDEEKNPERACICPKLCIISSNWVFYSYVNNMPGPFYAYAEK